MNRGQRGAVLVESAFAIALILLCVYGTVQLGIVGLEQLTVDGGAYTAAHQQALLGANLKNYEDAPTLAKATLPHLTGSNVTFPEPTFGLPPTADAPSSLQYNLAKPDARHGGVSMVQPVQTMSYVNSANVANLLLGFAVPISVSGVAIDPAFRLIDGHADVSGFGFNNTNAFGTKSDPLVDGDNAPPYFVGFNFVKTCSYAVAANKKSGWTTCPQPGFASLGLAEYLDVNNWGRPFNGVVPDREAVFYETRVHQDKFADIATLIAGQSLAAKAAILDPTVNPYVACVYSFDNGNLGSYAVGSKTIGAYPLDPAGNSTECAGP